MKSVKYALLLMASPFIIVGCGGGSSAPEGQQQEQSAADVAANIELQPTQEQAEVATTIATIIENNGAASAEAYRKANWIPGVTATTSKQLATYASKVSVAPASNVVSNKVISNGDDTSKWYIYSGDKSAASISSENCEGRAGKVIRLSGQGKTNGYALGWTASDWADISTNKLNDTVNKTIKWSMKFDEDYIVYVRVSTPNGYRYLYYTAADYNMGVVGYDSPHYIHNGLGSGSNNGTWKTFTRNLTADLKRFDPTNKITSVDGFFVRGSGCIDDVELLTTACPEANAVVYEDAEDGLKSRWSIYDNAPAGATIENVNDAAKASKVIAVNGSGLDNGFILGAWDSKNGWKNTINKEISWDMNFNDRFVIYVSVITSEGHRFMTYSPMSDYTFAHRGIVDLGIHDQGGYRYIHLGLNPNTRGGSWQTIARNLEADLKKFEPNNSLVSVTSFLVRGSGKLDNIKMFDSNTYCNDESTN